MMILLGITVALIIFLITMLIVLSKRKKCSSCSPKETLASEAKAYTPVKPQQEAKSVVKAEAAASPQITATENTSSPFPQDSILRRHYFTYLCTMLDALVPPRPTDSVLCRHYDTMIVTKIAQCLSDKKTTEQLIYEYEQLSA